VRVTELPLLGAPPAEPVLPVVLGGPLAAKGFRPFFLLAAVFAAAILPIWLLALAGVVRPDAYLDAMSWHAHEMVFGFSAAVIGGFLLTAASNWTGRATLTGAPLLALSALWVAARVVLVMPSVPRALVAGLDLAFLPAVALAIARPIAASKNRRHYVMVGVLLALWAANLAVHLDALGLLSGLRRRGVLVGVDIVILLIVIIAGRIFPMFTRNATSVSSVRSHPRLDVAAIVATALLVIADASMSDLSPGLTALVAAVAALLTAARAVHWGTRRIWSEPLVWVLHVGYAWIPIGLALRAAAYVSFAVPPSLATHALTVGAIGGTILGMMARVSLGHTGRPLAAGIPMAVAFALVTGAAVARVFGPLVDLLWYRVSVHVAGALWTLAFALFVVVFAPVLTRARIDGKPG
jgi:uncharacterized protein involved in response to NO